MQTAGTDNIIYIYTILLATGHFGKLWGRATHSRHVLLLIIMMTMIFVFNG